LANRKQFRIKYYSADDSQLYTIIQVAPTSFEAITKAEERIRRSTENFQIVLVEDLNSDFYINQIRDILTTSIQREKEREAAKWVNPKKVKRKMA